MNFDTLPFLPWFKEEMEKKYFKVVKFYLVYSTNHAKKDNVESKIKNFYAPQFFR